MTTMLTVLVAVAAVLAPGARGHGWISSPMARPLCDGREPNGIYMPGGGNGAGPGMHDLGGVPGVCGDPFQTMQGDTTNFVNEPCSIQETYTEGWFLWRVIQMHALRHEWWYCPVVGFAHFCTLSAVMGISASRQAAPVSYVVGATASAGVLVHAQR